MPSPFSIKIRKALPSDLEELRLISQTTFIEAFARQNTEENMRKYMSESFSPDKLANELSNTHSEFYLAISGKKTIGYLKINSHEAQTELKDARSLEIERIYVLKEFYGKKAGQLLLGKAIQLTMQKNMRYLWLGVWEKNPRAISFYKKNGFVEFDRHIFKLGDDEQTDIIMKLEIKPILQSGLKREFH